MHMEDEGTNRMPKYVTKSFYIRFGKCSQELTVPQKLKGNFSSEDLCKCCYAYNN